VRLQLGEADELRFNPGRACWDVANPPVLMKLQLEDLDGGEMIIVMRLMIR